MKVLRIGLILAGLGFVSWGVVGLFAEQSPPKLAGLAVWLGGAIIAHDGILVPVVLLLGLVGWRLLRRLSNPVRQVVASGVLVAGMLSLLALPSIIRHPVASNPSALPQDYGQNLALLLLAVLSVTVVVALLVWRRVRVAAHEELEESATPE